MTSSFGSCIIRFSLLLFLFLSFSDAQPPPPPPPLPPTSRPTSIQFESERDPLTLQYMININQGTPLAAKKLVLDLGGKLSSFDCHKGYNSSSYKPVKCTSSTCALASKYVKCASCNGTGRSAKPWCHKNACSIYTSNPITQGVEHGELFTDVVTVQHNKEFFEVPPIVVPRRFAFGCAITGNYLRGLAKSAQGVAGLGRSSALSLVSQFSTGFRFPRIFALDFSTMGGRIFFGGGPYVYEFGSFFGDLREHEISYTPLLINPKSPEEYFIDVKSILIYDEKVPIDMRLLSINKTTGVGGTKVDFQTPYTILQTSIYKAVTKVHREWAKSKNMTMVPPIAPFGTCYNSSTLPDALERLLRFPDSITFLFNPRGGMSTLSDMKGMEGRAVVCLALIDGGKNPKTSIIIGQSSLNFFVEFDISRSRFGYVGIVRP